MGNKGEETISLTIPKNLAHFMLGIYFICFPRNASGLCSQALGVIFGFSWLGYMT